MFLITAVVCCANCRIVDTEKISTKIQKHGAHTVGGVMIFTVRESLTVVAFILLVLIVLFLMLRETNELQSNALESRN